MDTLALDLNEAIYEAAQASGLIINVKINANKRSGYKPWEDNELRTLRANSSKHQKLCRKKGFSQSNLDHLHLLKKNFRKIKRNKIDTYRRNIKDTIARISKSSEFWQTVKELRRPAQSPNPIPIATWETYYEKIFPARTVDNTEFFDVYHLPLDATFTYREVKKLITRSKKNKSPGPDGIQNEHLQHLPPIWIKYLVYILNKIWNTEQIPQSWPLTTISVLHKKDMKDDPANYRGIALLNNLLKLLTAIIQRRLDSWIEDINLLPEEQAGFRKGRSCLDQIFTTTTSVQSKIRMKGSVVYCIFVDFTRAFDSKPHQLL